MASTTATTTNATVCLLMKVIVSAHTLVSVSVSGSTLMYFLLLSSVPIGMGRRTVGTRPTENGGCSRSSLFRSNAGTRGGTDLHGARPRRDGRRIRLRNDRRAKHMPGRAGAGAGDRGRVHLREAHASSDATDRRQHEERREGWGAKTGRGAD